MVIFEKTPLPSPFQRPEFALLLQLLALLQLILPEDAAHHRAAMLIEAIDEVLVGHADTAAFPTLDVSLINAAPPLLFRIVIPYRTHWLLWFSNGRGDERDNRQNVDRSRHSSGVSAGLLLIPNALERSPVCGLGTGWQQAHLKEIQLRKGVSALTHRQ